MRRAASGPCRPLIVGGDRLVLATNVDHHLLDDLDANAFGQFDRDFLVARLGHLADDAAGRDDRIALLDVLDQGLVLLRALL